MNAFDLGLLLLRLVVGLTFAAHGAQKAFGWWKGAGWMGWTATVTSMGFRPPWLWSAVSTAAELGGGLSLALGFLTPLGAMVLLGQSVVIILKAHWAKGFWNKDGGFEFPLSLAAGVAALGLAGPGAVSLDAVAGIVPAADVRIVLLVIGLLGGAVSYATSLAQAPRTVRPNAQPDAERESRPPAADSPGAAGSRERGRDRDRAA